MVTAEEIKKQINIYKHTYISYSLFRSVSVVDWKGVVIMEGYSNSGLNNGTVMCVRRQLHKLNAIKSMSVWSQTPKPTGCALSLIER